MAETAILLIDGNNLVLEEGKRLNLETLKRYLEGKFTLLEAHYFFALRPIMEEEAYERHQGFLNVLVRTGYRTHQKLMRKGFDSWKGDCDIDIALAATEALQKADWVILLTNDTDFTSVIAYSHQKGGKVAIVSVERTAWDLKNEADLVLDISEEPEMFFSVAAEASPK